MILSLPSIYLWYISIVIVFNLFGIIQSNNNDNIIWYNQSTIPQTCNLAKQFHKNIPALPVKYQYINTPYTYNNLNSTGLVALAYGLPCTTNHTRDLLIFDYTCQRDQTAVFFLYGYIMYNPDIRYNQWLCLGEEPRIARYHASYATITLYNNPYYSTINNNTVNKQHVQCSVVCIIGGQQTIEYISIDFRQTIIKPTKSVLCMSIDTTLDTNNNPSFSTNWIEAESLPYNVVGATAIYSNGTLLVIGGIRDNYDRDTTNSILEADVDPNTCLPYNWRNLGYSNSSRLGNQKLIHNWLPYKDIFENRTLISVTEGPPAYPKLSGDSIYDQYPHIYIPSYYPSIIVSGGLTIPSNLSFVPSTFSFQFLFTGTNNYDTYYIPLQPLQTFYNTNGTSQTTNALELISQTNIHNNFKILHNPLIPINLYLPILPSNHLGYVTIIDKTMKSLYRDSTILNPQRKYRWIYQDNLNMYIMDTSGDIFTSWEPVYHETILDYDYGDINIGTINAPAGSNVMITLMGNSLEHVIVATNRYTSIAYIGYISRCRSCIPGKEYAKQKCKSTPFEVTCKPCSTCSSTSNPPSYLLSSCTRDMDAKCNVCTKCYGGSPLHECNGTVDTVCNPELEALVLLPKWKRIPIATEQNMEYLYIFFTIFLVWLCGSILFSIYKTYYILVRKQDELITQELKLLSSSTPSSLASTHHHLHTLSSMNIHDLNNKRIISFSQIFGSSVFRYILLSTIHYTFPFMFGTFTIFTYIFFNYSILLSLIKEETIVITADTFSIDTVFYIGKEIRQTTFIYCSITLCFLFLSIICNVIWLMYQYYTISTVPILYYLLIPWLCLHPYLVDGWYRYVLIPFQQQQKQQQQSQQTPNISPKTISNINTNNIKVIPKLNKRPSLTIINIRLKIEIGNLLYSFSSACSDWVQFFILLILSDIHGGTLSSARSVTVGVALCSLLNILLSIYKLCLLLYNYNQQQQLPVLSNNIEKISSIINNNNNNNNKENLTDNTLQSSSTNLIMNALHSTTNQQHHQPQQQLHRNIISNTNPIMVTTNNNNIDNNNNRSHNSSFSLSQISGNPYTNYPTTNPNTSSNITNTITTNNSNNQHHQYITSTPMIRNENTTLYNQQFTSVLSTSLPSSTITSNNKNNFLIDNDNNNVNHHEFITSTHSLSRFNRIHAQLLSNNNNNNNNAAITTLVSSTSVSDNEITPSESASMIIPRNHRTTNTTTTTTSNNDIIMEGYFTYTIDIDETHSNSNSMLDDDHNSNEEGTIYDMEA